MLKFVIPQPGSATITLHQEGDNNPLVFGTSVVAEGEIEHEGILFCTPRGMLHHEVEVVAARVVRASTLQRSVLDAPLNANGAHDLSALQPAYYWHYAGTVRS